MNKASIRLVVVALGFSMGGPAAATAADGPGAHTAGYQTTAPPGRYDIGPPAGGSTYERYVNPPSSYPGAVAPPPGVIDRAQSAAAETGNSLRQSIESGIQQANEQFSRSGGPVLDAARDVGQGFSDQFRDLGNSTGRQLEYTGNNVRNTAEQSLGAAGESLRQVGNAFGVSGASPPPGVGSSGPAANVPIIGGVGPPPLPAKASTTAPEWSSASPLPTSGAARPQGVAPTASGWTTLNSNVPPPPLLTPSMAPPAAGPANVLDLNSRAPADSVSGPQFPNSASTGRATIHSQLVDQATQAPAPAQTVPPASNWVNDWNTRAGSPAAGNDRYNLPPLGGGPNSMAGKTGPERPAEASPGALSGANSGWPFGANAQTAPPPAPTSVQTNLPRPAAVDQSGVNTSGANAGQAAAAPLISNTNANSKASAPAADQPWMPLVLVSLTLIGSVSANLFLGWSYMDARQKYRTLVRKTADKFRRAAEAA